MLTIGEFILARVDDDAFLAEHMVMRRAQRGPSAVDNGDVACLDAWDPRRVLVSCAARRHLVLEHRAGAPRSLTPCDCGRPGSSCPPCATLRALALEWAEHPDYRADWRPHPVPQQVRSA